MQSLNFYLKRYNISILNIKQRSQKFHARFSAKKRVYEYIILNRLAKPVIDKNRSWHVKKKLDLKKMKKAIKYFLGLMISLLLDHHHAQQKVQLEQ